MNQTIQVPVNFTCSDVSFGNLLLFNAICFLFPGPSKNLRLQQVFEAREAQRNSFARDYKVVCTCGGGGWDITWG